MKAGAVCIALAVWLGGSTAALAEANVELGPVGDDEPNFVWCMKAQHKVKPGQYFTLVFRGRSLAPYGVHGRIQMPIETFNNFAWLDYLMPDPDDSPTMYFSPTMAVLSGNYPGRLRVRPDTRPGQYAVGFFAMADDGSFGLPVQSCTVDVVSELPDVEVTELRYEPAQTGVATRTVTMTVRNNMPATQPAIASVPWVLAASRQRTARLRDGFIEAQFASGTQTNVAPGSSFQVTGQVPAPTRNTVGGIEQIVGRVDPANIIQENDDQRGNNRKAIAREYNNPPPPVVVTPAHTCEAGMEEVPTEGGVLGCAQVASGRRECRGFWDAVFNLFSGGCETAYHCSTQGDCRYDAVCPQSGGNAGRCTAGHIP